MKKTLVTFSLCFSILLVQCVGVFAQQSKPTPNPVSQNQQNSLTNADIIRMVKGGFGESVIINAIQTNETQFDISMNALFELKNAGVSQKIIEAIQLSVSNKRQTQVQSPVVSVVPKTTETAQTLSEEQIKNLPQPFVLGLNQNKQTVLPINAPNLVQTKAKGDNMAAILADDAIKTIAGTAIVNVAANAAANVILSTGSSLPAIPIIGGAMYGIGKILKLGSNPTFTYLYALEGRQSKNQVGINTPKFEIFYGDVVGANPDEFEPILIKINPTPNNWRLVGAQKSKEKWYKSSDKNTLNLIEEIIPSRTNKLGRGHITIEPQQPLSPGEYGIVIRPISKTYKTSYQDIIYRKGEGLLLSVVWDFSIPALTENTQSTNSTSKQNSQSTISQKTNTDSTSNTQSLPIYGNIADIKSFTRIYVYAEDTESRERIIKAFKNAPQFQIVGNLQEAQIILEYKVLSRDSNADRGNKDTRIKSQLSAIYTNNSNRVVAWSDTAEYARLTSGGIGFQTQNNEAKLTERFIKAMKH